MNDPINSSNSTNTGIPASNLGMVLQRGGEELILEKVLDRFSVRLVHDISPQALSQVSWGTWQRSIPQAKLEIFTVAPNQLETAMSQARADQNVAFASHIYKLKDNPGTFVYLNDQITIQFATDIDASQINSLTTTFNLVQDKPVLGIPNTFVFLVSKQATENPIKIANQLQGLPEVLAAEPNILVRQETHYKPRDPLYAQQWYLNHNGGNQLTVGSHISVEKAWDITRGVRSVVIAVTIQIFKVVVRLLLLEI